MAVHRMFIIWTHQLFHESVRLLLDHPDVVWVGATSNYKAAKEQILSLLPDTVLVEEVNDNTSGSVLEILKACSGNVRVIGLSLEDNRLSLYQHQEQIVGTADDLLAVVLSSSE